MRDWMTNLCSLVILAAGVVVYLAPEAFSAAVVHRAQQVLWMAISVGFLVAKDATVNILGVLRSLGAPVPALPGVTGSVTGSVTPSTPQAPDPHADCPYSVLHETTPDSRATQVPFPDARAAEVTPPPFVPGKPEPAD